MKDNLLEEAISSLPVQQQHAIKHCVSAAKLKDKRGMRYSPSWVYECLLLRIKSKKAYEHLRQHSILPLPSHQTLLSYIQKVKGSFGFMESTFTCLKKKASYMDASERRGIHQKLDFIMFAKFIFYVCIQQFLLSVTILLGVILIDEMKLAEGLHFNRQDMTIHGFTDLGEYTPEGQQDKVGDHALVFMYQPFRGKWVQALACFLSKGAASGFVLHKLVMECVVLLEKSGFFVDAIVSDGASWNRNMWQHFGINEENISCSHILDENRKLWFVSDFPHLIKNVRNSISSAKQMMVYFYFKNKGFF